MQGKILMLLQHKRKHYICVTFFLLLTVFLVRTAQAGTLSCAVRSGSCNGGEVNVFKLNNTSNSHAGLSGSSSYTQLVCCGGVTGLGTNCSGTYATVINLSSVNNAHLEKPSGGGNYTQSVCLSAPSGGTLSVGYQTNNCTGFDTTVASMSDPNTNAHGGDGTIYNNKICATASGASGSVSADIVDSGGNTVSTPSVSLTSSNFSWGAQQPTGTLGISAQKIRVTSTLSSWSLSMAATSGPTALWQSGGNSYDFNGTAGAGRLQIDASGGTLIPQGGCSNSGLSKGGAAYFAQGSEDSITLLTGTSAQTGCYWDLTGVGLTQDLPSAQIPGNYSIEMTLTAA